jgi:hypothetical protein
MGWTYRNDEQMEAYGTAVTDPIVEALLVPVIRRIKPVTAYETPPPRVNDRRRGNRKRKRR